MGSKMIWSRRGSFRIADHVIDDDCIAVLCKLFSNVVIISAEHDLLRQEIKYRALSENFDSVPTGQTTPEYTPIVHKKQEDGGEVSYSIEWRLVPIIPSISEEIITILDTTSTPEEKVAAIEKRLRLTKQIYAAIKSPRANPVAAQDTGGKNDPGDAGPGNASPPADGQAGVGPTKTEGV